jgi:hypothetical protein
MFEKMLKILSLSCRHSNLSVPFPIDVATHDQGHLDWPAEELPRGCSHYVVCLECGRRYGYDWGAMKMVKSGLRPAG